MEDAARGKHADVRGNGRQIAAAAHLCNERGHARHSHNLTLIMTLAAF
jgi:hypothetical protein